MKKKKLPLLNSEEMKNTVASIDYEKPGVHVIGGAPGGCTDGDGNLGSLGCSIGYDNMGEGGCVDGFQNEGAPFPDPKP